MGDPTEHVGVVGVRLNARLLAAHNWPPSGLRQCRRTANSAGPLPLGGIFSPTSCPRWPDHRPPGAGTERHNSSRHLRSPGRPESSAVRERFPHQQFVERLKHRLGPSRPQPILILTGPGARLPSELVQQHNECHHRQRVRLVAATRASNDFRHAGASTTSTTRPQSGSVNS
jgi:hypothetical protein